MAQEPVASQDPTEVELASLGERLTPERIAIVDRTFRSPKERAEEVWEVLDKNDFSRYDILCFCTEFMGQLALGMFSTDRTYVQIAIRFGRWLHNAHYFHTVDILGQPEKGKRK
ncbi:MAG: hypothetical protein GY906_37245 [bacterium]|nr:hypothetical protein [bacterium]